MSQVITGIDKGDVSRIVKTLQDNGIYTLDIMSAMLLVGDSNYYHDQIVENTLSDNYMISDHIMKKLSNPTSIDIHDNDMMRKLIISFTETDSYEKLLLEYREVRNNYKGMAIVGIEPIVSAPSYNIAYASKLKGHIYRLTNTALLYGTRDDGTDPLKLDHMFKCSGSSYNIMIATTSNPSVIGDIMIKINEYCTVHIMSRFRYCTFP